MNQEVKSILVTGGAGFVGSCLAKCLIDQYGTSKITILDNFHAGEKKFIPNSDRISLSEIDIRNQEEVFKLVSDLRPQLVFHLAALHFIPYCNSNPIETLQVNVIGTQNLLESLKLHQPYALVATSSAAVYPIKDGTNHESEQAGPTDVYGLSKAMNEMQVEAFSREVKTFCSVIRLFNVFGPNETNPHVIPEIFQQASQGLDSIALGNTRPKRDYVYVSDVAEAFISVARKSKHPYRVYNVGTGHEYSVREIVKYVGAISGQQIDITVDAGRVRKSDRMHLLADVQRIREEIGWRPMFSLESGLKELWESLRRNV